MNLVFFYEISIITSPSDAIQKKKLKVFFLNSYSFKRDYKLTVA